MLEGSGDTSAEFTGDAVTAKGLSSDPVDVKRKHNKIWSVYSDAFFSRTLFSTKKEIPAPFSQWYLKKRD